MSPIYLDSWLKDPQNQGYDEVNGLLLQTAIHYPGSQIVAATPDYNPLPVNNNSINWMLDNCNMVIAHVKGSNGGFQNGHYVLIIKRKNNDYYIYDPWYRTGDTVQTLDQLTARYTFLDYMELFLN